MLMRRGIILKSPREVELIREAGRLVHRVLSRLSQMAAPGVTTIALNQEAERMITAASATPLFKGVCAPHAKFPFPAAVCASVNEEIVHGIPHKRTLKTGEVLSLDCGVRLNGYCGDPATTVALQPILPEIDRLLQVTRSMLELALAEVQPGRRWSQIAKKMQRCAEENGFSVVRDFVGHGIGQEMHEEPKVPNYYDREQAKYDFVLRQGMVIAVEPMVVVGAADVEYKDQHCWTVVTRDRKYAAHFEHTIAVTDEGCDVLTDGR